MQKNIALSACTLFEGHYHYGVATLINSLYKNGFCGDIFVGYKGALPAWAAAAKPNDNLGWKDAKKLSIAADTHIHFLPVTVNYQLTNYKPDFVIELWQGPAKSTDGIFYFDPDIVIKCNWDFFRKWINYGIALVHEIINNDMSCNHPVRQIWTEIIRQQNLEVKHNIRSYINAGFFGVMKKDIEFLHLYSKFIEVSIANFNIDVSNFQFSIDRTNPFFAKDQDALNIAAMCTESRLSEYGPEAMDFIQGGKIMSHAVGPRKPWKKKYLASFLKGLPPTLADKNFWMNADGIIRAFSPVSLKYKTAELKLASFLGRFYKRY